MARLDKAFGIAAGWPLAPGSASGPRLAPLSLSATEYASNATDGAHVAFINGRTGGSTVTIMSPADGRLVVNDSSTALLVGLVESSPGEVDYTFRETVMIGGVTITRDTTIAITCEGEVDGILVSTDAELLAARATLASTGGVILIAKPNTITAAATTFAETPATPIEVRSEDLTDLSPFPFVEFDDSAPVGPYYFHHLDHSPYGVTTEGGVYNSSHLVANAPVGIEIAYIKYHGPAYDPTDEAWASALPTQRDFIGSSSLNEHGSRFNGLNVHHCDVMYVYNFCKPLDAFATTGAPAEVDVNFNRIDVFHSDILSLGIDPPKCGGLRFRLNLAQRCSGRSSDLGGDGPHPDLCQLDINGNGEVAGDILVEGNGLIGGVARGACAFHIGQVDGGGSSTDGNYGRIQYLDNWAIVEAAVQKAPGVYAASGGIVSRQRIVRVNPTPYSDISLCNFDTIAGGLPCAIMDSYLEQFGGANDTQSLGNMIAPLTGAARATRQAGLFEGTFDGTWPTTMAEAVAMIEYRSDGDMAHLRGAFNYETGERNIPHRSFVPVKTVDNQTAGGTYTSPIMTIMGGDENVGWDLQDLPAGVTYRLFDDMAGTNPSSYSSTAGVVSRPYIQWQVSNPATGSTTRTWGVELDGYAYQKNLRTAGVLAFHLIDNQAAAWAISTAPPSEANQKYGIIMLDVQSDATQNGRVVYGNGASGNNLRLLGAPGDRMSLRIGSGGTISVELAKNFGTSRHRIVMVFDLSADAALIGEDAVLGVWVDGEKVGYQAGYTILLTGAGVFNPSTIFASLGWFNYGGGGTNIFNGKLGGFGAYWSSTRGSMPRPSEITSAHLDALSADRVGSNGELDAIFADDLKLFHNEQAAAWNAGFGIKGTVGTASSLTMTKQAGTFLDA